MKQSNRWNRVGFAVSFWGAVFVAMLTLCAGNVWVTVFQRAAIGFIALYVVTTFLIQIWILFAESSPPGKKLSESNLPQPRSNESQENVSNEIGPGPEQTASEFVPWDFNTPETMQGFRQMMKDGEG